MESAFRYQPTGILVRLLGWAHGLSSVRGLSGPLFSRCIASQCLWRSALRMTSPFSGPISSSRPIPWPDRADTVGTYILDIALLGIRRLVSLLLSCFVSTGRLGF